MIEWLSSFNYDYALASIPIQIILMVFYCARRNLPIRASKSFLFVMISSLVMTIADIAACEVNEIWTQFPLWWMYMINIIYFLAFVIRGWTMFDYCAEVCQVYRKTGRPGQILSAVPAAAMILLILSTPWTNLIFGFSAAEGGYYNSVLYSTIYISSWFYIGLSLFTILLCWKLTNLRIKIGLFSYNAILILGTLLRHMFYHTLVMSYFSILAILVIYLTSQNPDLYRDRQTHLFNKDAFDVIGSEFLHKNIPFHCVIISAHNYETAKIIYGYSQLRRSILLIGRWMITHFKGYYVFYFGNGNYILFHKGTFQENRDQTIRIINERFEHSWTDIDTEVSLSMSVMVLPYEVMPKNIHRIDDLIRYVFHVSYAENNLGHVIIEKDIVKSLNRKEEVEFALGRALEEHRLEAWFQPIYSTEDDRIIGAEALARLKDPQMGFIPPSEFIEIAEQTGDIMDLGRQIFDRVCSFAENNPLEELGIEFINVNLSPAQCLNENLAFELLEIANEHQVPLNMLDFEITETSITDFSMIKKQMVRLREQGAELSLDDFGAGMSNLNSLMQLPIHIVKIDMDVVRSYFSGETSVLPDLVRLFQNADMRIVVEGVETEEMKNVLAEMGCDFQQGYFFSRPLPPEEFIAYLQNQKLVKS